MGYNQKTKFLLMKKIVSALFVTVLFVACGNNTANDETGVKSAPVTPGIDNVNGNIPDTTETIRLNRPMPTDSLTGSPADTATRR
jgi:hypothetical protein